MESCLYKKLFNTIFIYFINLCFANNHLCLFKLYLLNLIIKNEKININYCYSNVCF